MVACSDYNNSLIVWDINIPNVFAGSGAVYLCSILIKGEFSE